MAIEGTGKGQACRSLAKDFHRLMKNITGMSGGQARLVGWDDTDLEKEITVSVIPDSGLYKDGEFIFSIHCDSIEYPDQPPEVFSKTPIFHPNIQTVMGYTGYGPVCLNMFQDEYWSGSMTLEDVVQGILFLMHNPNLEDSFNSLVGYTMGKEEFEEYVRCSLEGGMVKGFDFERNRVEREEGGAITADEGSDKEDAAVTTDGGGVVGTDSNAGAINAITDGGRTKEIIDEDLVKESSDVITGEGGDKEGEVVITGEGRTKVGEVVIGSEGVNKEGEVAITGEDRAQLS